MSKPGFQKVSDGIWKAIMPSKQPTKIEIEYIVEALDILRRECLKYYGMDYWKANEIQNLINRIAGL